MPRAEKETTKPKERPKVVRLEDLQTTVDALVAKALQSSSTSRSTGTWDNYHPWYVLPGVNHPGMTRYTCTSLNYGLQHDRDSRRGGGDKVIQTL